MPSFSDGYSYEDLSRDFSKYDLKRLDLYSRNMADHHLITDLLPLCMLTAVIITLPVYRPTTGDQLISFSRGLVYLDIYDLDTVTSFDSLVPIPLPVAILQMAH